MAQKDPPPGEGRRGFMDSLEGYTLPAQKAFAVEVEADDPGHQAPY